MGLLYFTPKGWSIFSEFVASMESREVDQTDCTKLLRQLLKNGVEVGVVPAVKKWFEFDSESDLKIYLENFKESDLF